MRNYTKMEDNRRIKIVINPCLAARINKQISAASSRFKNQKKFLKTMAVFKKKIT